MASLFCDFRYMAEGAKLTTAFAKRGLIAEHRSSWLLPRLIGPMNALDLLYSARMVDAVEAERLGLVRRLPAENFLVNVQAAARELVTNSSSRCISVIKRQVFQSYFQCCPKLGPWPARKWSTRSSPRTSRRAWRISSKSAQPPSPAGSSRFRRASLRAH
jgi:hypothetical protein